MTRYPRTLGPDETAVPVDTLEQLQRKARAHDDYLRASREMYGQQARHRRGLDLGEPIYSHRPLYWAGWFDCLHEFGAAVLRAERGEKL